MKIPSKIRLTYMLAALIWPLLLIYGQACTGQFNAATNLIRTDSASSSSSGSTGSSSSGSSSAPSTAVANTCDLTHITVSNRRTEFRSVASQNVCATVNQSAATPGGFLMSYDCSGGPGFQFRPVLQSDCTYQIQTLPINGVLCLDADSGDAPLLQQACNSTLQTQRWTLVQNADQSYSMRSNDNRCIHLMSANNGDQMHVKACDGSNAQKFTLAGLANSVLYPAATTVTNPTAPPEFTTNLTYVHMYGNMVSASANMTATGSDVSMIWGSPMPGAYIEYPLTVDAGGNYSLQVTYSSWMAGAGVNVSINGQSVGFMGFPISDSDTGFYPAFGVGGNQFESAAFPVVLKTGKNLIRLSMPASGIPYAIAGLVVEYDGQQLTKVGYANPIAITGVSNIDISAIYRLYRFTLDSTLGVYAWRYPHSVAHLEYKVNAPVSGQYQVKVTYSVAVTPESVDVVVNGPEITGGGYDTAANIPFTSTGASPDGYSTSSHFVDSDWVTITLPAGVSRLDFRAHSTPTEDFAISGIAIKPLGQ